MNARPFALAIALVASLVLAGCASRGAGRSAVPPPAPSPPPVATPVPVSPTPLDSTDVPRAAGVVSAPWDTAARSRDVRRAHVYPQGESALGRKLVASLPDPAGIAPAEGGAAPAAPVPVPTTPAGDCWQAQLLGTSDPARAERVRAEAAALLGVDVRVVSAGGVHRVRAGGCLDSAAAQRLVERARAEGWPEAFRVQATP